jgi:hypothetical protein
MKKRFIILIVLLLIIAFGLIYKSKSPNIPANEVKKAEQIIKDKAKEDKIKQIEEERLKNIATTKIINDKLHKTQKLVCVEGISTWQSSKEKRGFIIWFDNTLHAELIYNYQFQYDLNNIQVQYIDNGTAYIKVNTDNSLFEIVTSLQTQDIKSIRDKSSFAVGFNEEDMKQILAVSEQDVRESLLKDENSYEQAKESLKEMVEKIVGECGLEFQFME